MHVAAGLAMHHRILARISPRCRDLLWMAMSMVTPARRYHRAGFYAGALLMHSCTGEDGGEAGFGVAVHAAPGQPGRYSHIHGAARLERYARAVLQVDDGAWGERHGAAWQERLGQYDAMLRAHVLGVAPQATCTTSVRSWFGVPAAARAWLGTTRDAASGGLCNHVPRPGVVRNHLPAAECTVLAVYLALLEGVRAGHEVVPAVVAANE
jgi:hypothetical protein